MPDRVDLTRRKFLKRTAAVAAISQLPIARSAHAAGSGTIRVGLVGCGGRGRGAVANVLEADRETQLVALGDVFEDQAADSLRLLKRKFGSRINSSRVGTFIGFDAYEKVIQSGVDLVLLTTPPGFRPLHFEAAVQAGKHVFMEKPLAVDAPGVRKVLATAELAKQKTLRVGAGFNWRHQNDYVETIRRVRSGAIGTVREIKVHRRGGGVWVRQRKPSQTEMEYQMMNWYYFVWLSGDFLVEQHVHGLDICQWIKGRPPTRARGIGGRKERFGPDHGEIFDNFQLEYSYDDGTRLISDCSHLSTVDKGVGQHVVGSLGNAIPSSGTIDGRTTWKFTGQKGNAYVAQTASLLDAIRNGVPYDETENGAMSTMIAIMGRMAAYEGREITWDEAVNSNEAYLPERYAWDADPPTLPDKFGDYVIPARGKPLS